VTRREFACLKPDCTFGLTGTCIESIDDPTRKCPNLKATDASSEPEQQVGNEGDTHPVANPARQFPTGLELGLNQAARIMRSRYTRLIGVLGQAEAGKTCLFTSLYLQLTGRNLCPKYRFAGSETLLGFEQRARHLRDWTQGRVPDQIVDRTHLGNPRSPAFLHLAFHDDSGTRHDVLLPDLPGEWTTRLLSDASTAERFGFLRRSDIVLLALEAPQFANRRTRNNAITDATHLLARLSDDISVPRSIPLVLAVTKCDETDGSAPQDVQKIADAALNRGYSVSTIPLAAFPRNGTTVPLGFGIDALVTQMSLPCVPLTTDTARNIGSASRSYLKARGHR